MSYKLNLLANFFIKSFITSENYYWSNGVKQISVHLKSSAG